MEYHILCNYTFSKLIKDEKAARIIPAVLHTISRNEITATIHVMKKSNKEGEFQIYIEDIYEISPPTTSDIDSSPNPAYPSFDPTYVFLKK